MGETKKKLFKIIMVRIYIIMNMYNSYTYNYNIIYIYILQFIIHNGSLIIMSITMSDY